MRHRCRLCRYPLGRSWTPGAPKLCANCGATNHGMFDEVEGEDTMTEDPNQGTLLPESPVDDRPRTYEMGGPVDEQLSRQEILNEASALYDGSYPPNLYDGSPPHEAPSTSQQAADSIKEVSGALRRQVLEHIRAQGSHGATDDEVEAALGLRHQSASARRRELALLGVIVSTSTRATRSGRSAKVWVVRDLSEGSNA